MVEAQRGNYLKVRLGYGVPGKAEDFLSRHIHRSESDGDRIAKVPKEL